MAFKVPIGAFYTTINKRLCFEKGINNTILLEQCKLVLFTFRFVYISFCLHFVFMAYLFKNGPRKKCERAAFSSTNTDKNEDEIV